MRTEEIAGGAIAITYGPEATTAVISIGRESVKLRIQELTDLRFAIRSAERAASAALLVANTSTPPQHAAP